MKIAQIAPLFERVPPKQYGGTERVVHALTEELVRRGHDITLFASGDSVTSARLVSVFPQSLREAGQRRMNNVVTWSMLNIGLAYSRYAEFDLIHDHSGVYGLAVANMCPIPVVSTMHGVFDDERRAIYSHLRRPNIVTISRAQAQLAPEVNHVATVYNGLPMEQYPFRARRERFLLFVGRIARQKGVAEAIDVAEALKLPLIIAAKLDPVDIAYFESDIKPRLNDRIQWIGEVDEQKRNELMSRALCFLHPANWPEPFGLTLIEAGACGCPVVAFGRGAIPEIIEDATTGFVVRTVPEMIAAVHRISQIDPAVCRRRALGRFNVGRMAGGYEAVYAKIMAEHLGGRYVSPEYVRSKLGRRAFRVHPAYRRHDW